MANTADNAHDELARRHGAAVRVVFAVFLFTIVLALLALALAPRSSLTFNPTLANTLRIVVVFLGIGSLYFRRTKFSAMRLRDIGALRGASGLLQTLQQTTVLVALIAAVIAALGFYISLLTGDGKDMLYFGVVAVAVLLYCFPRRAAWESVVNAAAEPPGGAESAAKGTIA